MEKIDIDKVELNVHDWIEMRQGALELLKNSMAQAIVYKGQIRTAETEIAKFPEPEVGKMVETKEKAEEKPKTEEKKADVTEKAPTKKT
ncbi:MAG TPA: hypothetical protein ENI22_01480 [Candidatus Pacearchaeota archaeon]|nr:hypothetical protein [Candidatus Pacearchaeota archaeon]